MTSFRLCLSQSRSPTSSLEEDLAIASAAGFTHIDLWSPKLDNYLATYPIVWLDIKLREHHVYPAAVSGMELAVRTGQEEDLVHQAQFLELCTHMDTLGGGIIVVHPKVQIEDGDSEVKATLAQTVPWMVRALHTYSDLAAPFDVHVAFEFRSDVHSPVRTLAASQEIVRQAARSNVGLSLNTLHVCKSAVKPEDLDALDVGKLKLVRLESGPSPSPPLRSEAVSPSPAGRDGAAIPMAREGESRLQTICEHLAAQGFQGPYCIVCPPKQKGAEPASGDQASPLECVLEAKQAALDLLTPLYL
jgi:sugar phosphate isomerase/epimerase